MQTLTLQAEIDDLTELSKSLLAGCRVQAQDGIWMYVPDGLSFYQALWTRDFAYMIENAGFLLDADEAEGCIRCLIGGQRADGVVPDRVYPDGHAVYSAGAEGSPAGEWNLDNGPFLVIAADAHLGNLPAGRALAQFAEWEAALKRGMRVTPLDSDGLVWNDPAKPHSPYGFTDTICKTGSLFYESLLFWDASLRLAKWYERQGRAGEAAEQRRAAERVVKALPKLWDEESQGFLAASQDCSQWDVWGNAFALYLDFPLGEKQAKIAARLVELYPRIVQRGQVRHLPEPETWERQLIANPAGEYQNGAYWATASGWMYSALLKKDKALAIQLVRDLCADFQSRGVYECVNGEYRKLDRYVASGVNPLGALRRHPQ